MSVEFVENDIKTTITPIRFTLSPVETFRQSASKLLVSCTVTGENTVQPHNYGINKAPLSRGDLFRGKQS